MKNLWVSASLLGLLFPVCYGETLQFVTRLSAPLGAVAQLDTANPAAVTEVPRVNFCTQQATSGDVSFTGGADPQFGTVSLGASRRITSDNLQELRVDYIYLRSGGSLTAGRLFADKITLPANKTTRGSVGESLYLNNISSFVDVQGVKADALYIKDNSGNNLAFINEAGSGTNLHWSNIYDHPYKSDGSAYENVDYAKQWVLKGASDQACFPSAAQLSACTSSGGTFVLGSTCGCTCPSGKVFYNNKCGTFGWELQGTATKTNQTCDKCHVTGNSGPQCHSYGSLITSTSLPVHWNIPSTYACTCNNTDESLGPCLPLVGECCDRDQAPTCNKNQVGKYYRYHDYMELAYDPEDGHRFEIRSSIYKCEFTPSGS